MIIERVVLCVGLIASPAIAERAALTPDKVNAANDPLTPRITLLLEDQYVGAYNEMSQDSNSNTALLRGVLPHKVLGWQQILRVTLPIVTTPDQPQPATTGLGDLSVFDLFLFKWYSQEFGIGPMFTFPTASEDRTGTGKWQAGAAAASIETEGWGLFGALVTYQHSFAGDSGRSRQSVLQAQPFIIVNLIKGFYARSTATWNFDLEQDTQYIPVGVGLGKVWLLAGGATLNAFIEPQFTVAGRGVGPSWQIFAGFNSQFPAGRP